MASSDVGIANPEWTESRKKNGLDPLGMLASSVNLYQALIPGISNVTLRMRYYGLYAWLARTYASEIGDTDPKQWRKFVCRAEALYALIATIRGGETGVAGVTWAAKILSSNDKKTVEFASSAEPGSPTRYLDNAWGAYGAAYGAQLYAIGILADAADHKIPVPSNKVGQAIAEAFEQGTGKVAARFFETLKKGEVSRSALADLASLLPSAIDPLGLERLSYEKVLFAKAGLGRPSDQSRSHSLKLVLGLVRQLKRLPSVAELRWQWYADGNAKLGQQQEEADGLQQQAMRWWAYQANELSHIAFELLLKFVLDRLEAYPDGVPLDRLLTEVVTETMKAEQHWPTTWAAFSEANAPVGTRSEVDLVADVMQAGRAEGVCSPEGVAKALRVLAMVYARAASGRGILRQLFAELDPNTKRSLWSELGFLESRAQLPLSRFIAELFEQRIVRRHLWVAMRKLRHQGDYTFLVEVDDGRVRLRAKDEPVFTNPRLATALTFLKDIHLVDKSGLTDRGLRVLSDA